MNELTIDTLLLSTASELLTNEELGEAIRLIITDGDISNASDKAVAFFATLVKKSNEERKEKKKRISAINSANSRKRSQAVADKKNGRCKNERKEEKEKEKDNEEEEKESNIKKEKEEETDKKNKEKEDAVACVFREKKIDEKTANIVSPINSVSTQKIELTQEEKEKKQKYKEEIKEIGEFWNSELTRLNSSLPKIVGIGVQRSSAITARLKENGIEKVKETITKAVSSEFLNSGTFVCGFDWCMKPTNFLKISEGNYNNKNKNQHAANKNAYGETRESASERLDRLFHLGKYSENGGGEDAVIDIPGCFGK